MDRRRRGSLTTGATRTCACAVPIVRGLQGAFAEHWLEATGEVLERRGLPPAPRRARRTAPGCNSSAPVPGVGDTNVESLYYLAIASARESLDLTAAYFVPRPAFTDALADAARRGVTLRILVPGPHIDKEFVRVAGRDAYSELLDAGARIFEYQPTMLHAKSMVVDGAWSSVGTVNFDNRSFQLHDEVTLCVWDEHFAELLTEQFERDLARSEELDARALGRSRSAPPGERGCDARLPPGALRSQRMLAAVVLPRCEAKRRQRAAGLRLPAVLRTRRAPARRPGLLGALGAADQSVLRFMRTKAPHGPGTEAVFKALGDDRRVRSGLDRRRPRGRGHRPGTPTSLAARPPASAREPSA